MQGCFDRLKVIIQNSIFLFDPRPKFLEIKKSLKSSEINFKVNFAFSEKLWGRVDKGFLSIKRRSCPKNNLKR